MQGPECTATVLTRVGAMHAYRLERRPEGNLAREYFIWEQAEYPHRHAYTTPAASTPVTSPATGSAAARADPGDEPGTAARGHLPMATAAVAVAYRPYPIAIGYGLATLLFAFVALRSGRRRGDDARTPPPGPEVDTPPESSA